MLRRIAFATAMLSVLMASAGCVLQSGGSNEPTSIPLPLPSETPVPTDMPTSGPTPEPEVFVITATPDVAALAQMTVVAQLAEETLDPLIAGVTLTLAAATQEAIDHAINMTASAEFVFEIPTETPTIDPTFAIPTATATFGGGSDCEHIVSAGQNLFRIGLQYNVGYQTLANYNGIANPNLISIGQRIVIPNCGIGGGNPVGSGGTGGTESGSFGGGGGGGDFSASTCGPEVLVDQGDTLFAISLRCNVLIRTIMSLNGISNPDMIYFNKTLRLQ